MRRIRPCNLCGEAYQPYAPSNLYCSEGCIKDGRLNSYLKRVYGITLIDYKAMLDSQNHLCKICGAEGFLMKEHHQIKLVVDHCHQSGKVRGLLCHNCNRALGLLKDSPEILLSAKNYLEEN